MSRKKQYRLFHDLLFEFQRVQRFAARDLGVRPELLGEELSHTEESILFVLDAENTKRNIKELSSLVGLERSWLSRMVTSLEQKKLVRSTVPKEDKRSKDLVITDRGRKKLLLAEQAAKQILEKSFEPLSAAEQSKLEKLLKKFADGLGARDFTTHSASHRIGYQLGRISAAIGIYGRGLFGTSVSVTQLHILLVLSQNKEIALQVKDLDTALPYDMSTVSRTVQALVNEGTVEKNKGIRDKRSVSLSLSSSGSTDFRAYKDQAVKILAGGLDPFSDDELESLLFLYTELTRSLPKPLSSSRQPELSIRSLPQESSLFGGGESGAPAKSHSRSKRETSHVGAYKGGKLVAAVKAEYVGSAKEVTSITLVNKGAEKEDCIALLEQCLR